MQVHIMKRIGCFSPLAHYINMSDKRKGFRSYRYGYGPNDKSEQIVPINWEMAWIFRPSDNNKKVLRPV